MGGIVPIALDAVLEGPKSCDSGDADAETVSGMEGRLNAARVAADLSWIALSKLAKMSPRHLRRLAAGGGKRGASLETIEQLAKALHVKPGWLAFGEG